MAKSIIQSFSLDITEAATLAAAEDKAKEQGKSFSKYLVHLIKEDLQKKDEGPLAYLSHQSTITEYIPMLYKNDTEKEKMSRFIETCDTENLTQLAIQVNEARKAIEKRRSINKSKSTHFRFGFTQ